MDPNLTHPLSPPFETLERNQPSASPQAVCHFLSSSSLTLSTEETFQINVFSSLKTFLQTFRSGKGSVSSGNGQAHIGTEWCEKEKKNQIPSYKWTDSVQETSDGSSLEDGEVSLEGKSKVNE